MVGDRQHLGPRLQLLWPGIDSRHVQDSICPSQEGVFLFFFAIGVIREM